MLKWFGHEVVWGGAEEIVLLQVFFLSVSNPTYYGELWESHTQISPGPRGGHGPVHHNKFTIISSPTPHQTSGLKTSPSKLIRKN